jgi:O-antigen/teichoic acid export membrane protein
VKFNSLRQALAAPLLLAIAVQNLGNLLLHAVLGRALGPASYGELGTLLAVLTLLTVPLTAVQAAASAAAAGRARAVGDGRRFARIAAWSAAVSVGILLATPLLVPAFHLETLAEAAILAPFVGVSILLATVRGRLLGHQRVALTAGTFIMAIGVRFLLTILFVGPWGIMGALVATLLGEMAGLALGAWAVFRAPVAGVDAGPWLGGHDLLTAAVALTGLFLFTTVDLFLARALLDPESSGAYVAAATIGKTLLALPTAALSAAYPRMVRAGRGPARGPELLRSGVVVVGSALVAGVVVALFPAQVLRLLFGAQFESARSLVIILALVAACSSIISVTTYAQLAVRSRLAFLPWAGAAVEILIIALFHETAIAVATGSAIALGVMVVATVLPLAFSISSAPRSSKESESQGSPATVGV